ncbi:hypothetical protein ACVWZA_002906 [Sphingomonas sp. UYAg733]
MGKKPLPALGAIWGLRRLLRTALASLTMVLVFAATPRDALASEWQAMTFSVITNPEFRRAEAATLGETVPILASGVIVKDTVADLRAFVRARGIKSATIYLNSDGGLMEGGMELGRAIRELRFNTDVGQPGEEAFCASACTSAYAGGVSRFLTKRSGLLGIHQFSSNAKPTRETVLRAQVVSAKKVDFLTEMGVDARLFSLASMTDADDIAWLSPETALSLGLANNGAQPATATIGTLKMRPYLIVQQEHHDMIGRALFFCLGGRLTMNAILITTPVTARTWATGSRFAYVELDGKIELAAAGADAVEAVSDYVTFTRAITPDMARRLIDTNDMAIRVRGTSLHGQSLDLRPGRETMRDFFRQCLPGGLPAPSVNVRDLVVASLSSHDGLSSVMIIDRNSIAPAGRLVRARVYGAAVEGKERIISVALTEFDCTAHRSRDVAINFHDVNGKLLMSDKRDWAAVAPGSGGNAVLLIACGKTRPDKKDVMGNEDPFELLRIFVDVAGDGRRPPSR